MLHLGAPGTQRVSNVRHSLSKRPSLVRHTSDMFTNRIHPVAALLGSVALANLALFALDRLPVASALLIGGALLAGLVFARADSGPGLRRSAVAVVVVVSLLALVGLLDTGALSTFRI